MKEPLTVDRLRSLLHYDPETGVFTWHETGMGRNLSRVAGGLVDRRAYVSISIDYRKYRAHRLAWFYVYGEWPAVIDHIDGNGLNNALSNLRPALRWQNSANSKRSKANVSGVKGVYWEARKARWCARIMVRGKYHYVGSFRDFEDAVKARKKAEIILLGEFRRAA